MGRRTKASSSVDQVDYVDNNNDFNENNNPSAISDDVILSGIRIRFDNVSNTIEQAIALDKDL